MRDKKKGLNAYQNMVNSPSAEEVTPADIPQKPKRKRHPKGGDLIEIAQEKTPEDGFIKTKKTEKGFIKESPPESHGYKKAASLLLLLGKERAAEVLSHFNPEEVEGIIHEIALIKQVAPEEARKILSEFSGMSSTGAKTSRNGGVDTARQMLEEAFGDEKGKALFHRYLPFGGEVPFAFLNDLEYPQIAMLLKDESPMVMSLVLSYITPMKASRILEEMLPVDRMEAISRMAKREKIDPAVIRTMEDIFRERIRTQGKVVTQEVDGVNALAGILKFMDPSREEDILTGLDEENPFLSENIREKIFTVQDILRIPDSDFQEALRVEEDKDIAIIIKGKPPMIRDKILVNLSERRRAMVEEESQFLGAMRKSEVEEVTKDFLQRLREKEESGEIFIPRGDDIYI